MKINKRILNNISLFEENINYEFTNKEYILEALTHSSYSNENKNYAFNERLEFLGDSVLSIVISDYLFKKETKLPEGELTKIRANIVCEESLSEVSKNIHLGKYMLLGKGEDYDYDNDQDYDDKENDEYLSYSLKYNNKSYSGTGDIFTSIISGLITNGHDFKDSIKIASDFIFKCIEYTSKYDIDPNDGVFFEVFLNDLTSLNN